MCLYNQSNSFSKNDFSLFGFYADPYGYYTDYVVGY